MEFFGYPKTWTLDKVCGELQHCVLTGPHTNMNLCFT